MARLRLGLIGCGGMGGTHMRRFELQKDRMEVSAAADIDEAARQRAAQLLPHARIVSDYRDVLDHADAVLIALPHHLHHRVALDCLAAGKHVLLEKPVAMNARDVRRIMAARGDRTVGCCASRHLFIPAARAVSECIASGGIGRLRSIHDRAIMQLAAKRPEPPPAWRLRKDLNGGGILMNWGCYDLTFLLGVTGWRLRPETVFAQTWPIPEVYTDRAAPGSDAEPHFSAMIRCAGGETITLERAEYTPTAPGDGVHILGDRGALRFRMIPQKQQVMHDAADAEQGVVTRVLCEDETDNISMHRAATHDFIDAVLQGRPCTASLERSLIVQEISDAVYRSAATGKAVRLRPTPVA